MNNLVMVDTKRIGNKIFVVPKFNLASVEKYFLPKREIVASPHTFYEPKEINELYQINNINPSDLECNLKFELQSHKSTGKATGKSSDSIPPPVQEKEEEEKVGEKVVVPPAPIRPALRQEGFTHFVHIPVRDLCEETYTNLIKTQIDPSDLDALVELETLHVTLLVFRLRSIEDLPSWEAVLKGLRLKKQRLAIKGVGIFPIKPNTTYTRVLYLKVEGLEEVVDDLVSSAVSSGLVGEKELANITFDKPSKTYKSDQLHVTLLKSKAKDVIDAKGYLKLFDKINVGRTIVKEVRLSVIGSERENQGYFDECSVKIA